MMTGEETAGPRQGSTKHLGQADVRAFATNGCEFMLRLSGEHQQAFKSVLMVISSKGLYEGKKHRIVTKKKEEVMQNSHK